MTKHEERFAAVSQDGVVGPASPMRSGTLWRALVGLQTGVLGGLAVLALHILDGLMQGSGPWAYANLISSIFDRSWALAVPLRWGTLSGIALHLFVSGTLGVVFAAALNPLLHRPLRYRLMAMTLSLAWYYASFRYLWPALSPAVVIHQPFPGMLLGHILFGVCMGLYPRFLLDMG